MLNRDEFKIPGKWVREAAMCGDAEALKLSFLTCFDGYCVTPCPLEESIKWLKKTANLEVGESRFRTDEAQFILGSCYSEGYGVPQDDKEAAMWYLRAAVHGCPA